MVMAKGIADGFPLAATITRPEIGDSFRPGEHLSTFGGNPVSCAAALANLRVMRADDLPGEAALRMAKIYTGKREIIALERSFHGRSYGTLSITGNMARKTRGGPYAGGVAFAPAPYTYRSLYGDNPEVVAEKCAQALEETIRFHTSGDVAAFIIEPVMGEGGLIVPPASYLRRVKEILDRHDILLIADEVQCGFGRTGKLFAI